MLALTQQNIANDAAYRAVQVANSMRAQGIVVYSIGLGTLISEPFLDQIANDSKSATYNPNEPIGEAVFSANGSGLDAAFQTIASAILLRLSR
jgi:hypothetical protein